MITMENKKSQHEILGFVLIVVIVFIIGLVFLSLGIAKGKSQKQSSIEVSNLLGASMYYTTDCAMNYVPQYEELQELIKECDKNSNAKCLNEKNVCSELESSLKNLIDNSLMISEDSPNKAYKLNIYHSSMNNLEKNDILYLEKGSFKNCSLVTGGSNTIAVSSFSSGMINVELELCSR